MVYTVIEEQWFRNTINVYVGFKQRHLHDLEKAEMKDFLRAAVVFEIHVCLLFL